MAQKRYTVVLSMEAKASLREGGRDSIELRSVSKLNPTLYGEPTCPFDSKNFFLEPF